MLKPLAVWITTNCVIKIPTLKEMGIPDYFTCPLRNLYAGHRAAGYSCVVSALHKGRGLTGEEKLKSRPAKRKDASE